LIGWRREVAWCENVSDVFAFNRDAEDENFPTTIYLHLFALFTRGEMSQSHARENALTEQNKKRKNKINYELQLFKERQISVHGSLTPLKIH